ncbi:MULTISPECIES: DUF1007 family protein [Methylobacterium]|uniref:EF-hand domain-containing protein n=1 Tax=Methylobacterium thuringiense TaxID=1003091 RepID=A0ABQ4TM83_9HYPH|nr:MULTISPECIES: DUF1007 family protein [Methylobacterium]TXN19246.1 DUF1007 family protein [Methylobacterium sp. WL9]GJE56111.1 hypothetical protein EKPJFOCH_2609 [Methylobacterium thuringiense]
MPTASLLRCAVLAAGLALTGPALAHPHVWIVAKAEIVYDGGRVVGVRHDWTFDAAYTATLTLGLDTDGDGRLSPEELQGLADENARGVAEFGYFTKLKVAGKEQAFVAPREPRMEMAGNQARLSFLLPLKAPPAQGRGVVALEISDPTNFVSFGLAEGPDAVGLKDAPAGCAVTISRPKTTEAKTAEAGKSMTEAMFEALTAAANFGVQYANRALVACP